MSQATVSNIVSKLEKDLEPLLIQKLQVDRALATENEESVIIINNIVDKKLAILADVNRFSLKAVETAVKMLDSVDSGMDLKYIVDAVDKVTVTNKINDRHPKQNNNLMFNGGINFSSMTDNDLSVQLREINDRVVATQ